MNVNPIELERKPQRPQLPDPAAIDHAVISEAAAGWNAARAALETARKDVNELELTKEAAEWKDAEAAEAARAEGKPEPKRTHVAAHDKKLDEARHEQRIATLAEQRTFDALQAAVDAHQGEWAESVERDVEALDGEWADVVDQLLNLHARRTRALAVRRLVVGGGRRTDTALGFLIGQIHEIGFASGQGRNARGWIAAGDVLGALADLGMPEPVIEPTPVQHRPPNGPLRSPNRGMAPVEEEIAERREFAEHAALPEQVEARQRRNEAHREANRLAAEEQAAG
jgi:hypothetical protein